MDVSDRRLSARMPHSAERPRGWPAYDRHDLGETQRDFEKRLNHRILPPAGENGSGPEARRDPAAQAGRRPQTAEFPFDSRCPPRESINSRFNRSPQRAKFPCAQSALIRPNLPDWVFLFPLPPHHTQKYNRILPPSPPRKYFLKNLKIYVDIPRKR